MGVSACQDFRLCRSRPAWIVVQTLPGAFPTASTRSISRYGSPCSFTSQIAGQSPAPCGRRATTSTTPKVNASRLTMLPDV